MGRDLSIRALIFIASMSSLSYEIVLTRVFSISLSYHFAFMVISIAMLGIAASGTILSVYPRMKDTRFISLYFLIFCASLPAGYLLINHIPFDPAKFSWDRAQIWYLGLYYIILSLPFFGFGLVIASALSTMKGQSGYLYGADLTGAGAGSVATLLLLSVLEPGEIVFVISGVLSLSASLYCRKRLRLASLLLLISCLAVLYLHPPWIAPRISPYKPLENALRFPGSSLIRTYHSPFSRVDLFHSPAVRFAPGLSLRYLGGLPDQTGISVDAGDIFAITDDSNRGALEFLRHLPSSLPFEMSPKNDVLILDPKGGMPVLAAEYYGAADVYKIDSNPLLIRAVQEFRNGSYSHIYRKNTWSGLGRSWLASSLRRFDLIDISLTGASATGSFGFSEDYRFTVEAFEEYIGHLSWDGMLNLNLFILPPPKTELRMLNTLIAAAEKSGIQDISSHIAAIRSWDTITLLLKRSALTREDIEKIKDFAEDRRFDLVYYPGITGQETNRFIRMPEDSLFPAFGRLLSSNMRDEFIKGYLFDIRPVRDASPFFHYHLRLKNAPEIYKLIGDKWLYFLEEGYLLPVILMQILLISSILVLLPAALLRSGYSLSGDGSLFMSLSYFACLGIGFMFVEISLIQKMVLPLENPSYAAATVLASMLISSGTGSFLSQRFRALQLNLVLPSLSLIILAYSIFLPAVTNVLHPYPLQLKSLFVFIILFPAGFLMGIPFPAGLSLLSRESPGLIPWAWAVNGCLSVLAPILAVMIAISSGFTVVIILGTVMYLLAFFCIRRVTGG
ncbi:MAG: hypothetical protein HZA17_05295 [Nitrospirae bacterium]|nr:hypothetical protein [Nitrospirota bacterium]